MVILDRFFFIWGTKNVVTGCVRQVVVLYSNDCMGIGLGGLSALVVLGDWLIYKGSHISSFDCNVVL